MVEQGLCGDSPDDVRKVSQSVRRLINNRNRDASQAMKCGLFSLIRYAFTATDTSLLLEKGANIITDTLSLGFVLVVETIKPDYPFCIRAMSGPNSTAMLNLICGQAEDFAPIWNALPKGQLMPGMAATGREAQCLSSAELVLGDEVQDIPIPGRDEDFGRMIIGGYGNALDEDHIRFIHSAAHVLAIAMDRIQSQQKALLSNRHMALAKRQCELMVDGLPQLVCLTDDRGIVLRANRAVESWGLGTVASVSGCHLHEMLHPHCQDECCHMAQQLTNTWRERTFHGVKDYELTDLDGERCLHFQIKHLEDIGQAESAGPIPGGVVIIRDVTGQKTAESLRRRAHERLEQRVAEMSAQLARSNERLVRFILRLKQSEAALRQSEGESRVLSAQLMAAGEQERKRIALELHDSISQILSSIKFRLEAGLLQCDKGRTKEGISTVKNVIPVIQQAIQEVRRISMDLRPSMLDDLGVLATAEWYCKEFQDTYGGIRIDVRIAVKEVDIAEHLKLVIYRVMQEALHNVARHAYATQVQLMLERVQGRLILRICDNGKGFSSSSRACNKPMASRGLGLRSMRERVEQAMGAFTVIPCIGSGTTIEASWPLGNGGSFGDQSMANGIHG
jgi:signal transduction histidine kinase